MVKHIALGGILALFSTTLLAQKQTGCSEGIIVEQKIDDSSQKQLKEGTYQFLLSKQDYKPLFTKELIDRIQQSRRENEDVELILDEYITLFLPSKNRIHSPGFVPLEPYKYLN